MHNTTNFLSNLATACCFCVLAGCSGKTDANHTQAAPTSVAERTFPGDNFDGLFEGLPWEVMQKVKKGDIIATKQPGLFLDFSASVAYNDYNSAFGKFAGWDRVVVTSKGEQTLLELVKTSVEKGKNKM